MEINLIKLFFVCFSVSMFTSSTLYLIKYIFIDLSITGIKTNSILMIISSIIFICSLIFFNEEVFMTNVCKYCGKIFEDSEMIHHQAYKCKEIRRLMIASAKREKGKIIPPPSFNSDSLLDCFVVEEFPDGKVFLQFWYSFHKEGLMAGEHTTTINIKEITI